MTAQTPQQNDSDNHSTETFPTEQELREQLIRWQAHLDLIVRYVAVHATVPAPRRYNRTYAGNPRTSTANRRSISASLREIKRSLNRRVDESLPELPVKPPRPSGVTRAVSVSIARRLAELDIPQAPTRDQLDGELYTAAFDTWEGLVRHWLDILQTENQAEALEAHADMDLVAQVIVEEFPGVGAFMSQGAVSVAAKDTAKSLISDTWEAYKKTKRQTIDAPRTNNDIAAFLAGE